MWGRTDDCCTRVWPTPRKELKTIAHIKKYCTKTFFNKKDNFIILKGLGKHTICTNLIIVSLQHNREVLVRWPVHITEPCEWGRTADLYTAWIYRFFTYAYHETALEWIWCVARERRVKLPEAARLCTIHTVTGDPLPPQTSIIPITPKCRSPKYSLVYWSLVQYKPALYLTVGKNHGG